MVTTVTMAHPVSSLGRSGKLLYPNREIPLPLVKLVGGIVLSCLPFCAFSAEWDASARLNLSETYTDNLRLSVNDQEHESITEIAPGFSLRGRGGRVKLNADYSMQNLFYAHNSANNKTWHRLNAGEQSELIKDWFYFDSSASISQQLINPANRLPSDNLNLAGNRSNVATLKVDPYLKRELGAYARTEVHYSHGWVDYGANGVSDAQSSVASASLANGHGATHLFWHVGYRQQKDIRNSGNNSERRSTNGMIRYRVLSSLSLVGYAGREDNNIQTSQPSANGNYWSVGFRWDPGPKFSLEGTKGKNDKHGRLTWRPTQRTSLELGYNHRDVGLNTAATRDGRLSHRTRHSTWALSYLEEVTSTQVLALQQQIPVFLTNDQGEQLFDPNTGEPLIVIVNSFGLTDEEFLRARGQGSVSYRTGKSTVTLVIYDETRTYKLSNKELSTRGGNATWHWRFASRTSSTLSVQGQRYDVQNSSDTAASIKTSLGLNRRLSTHVNARVDLSHLQADVPGTGEQYDENRISAHLNMRF
jgi:hypothetical protein